MGALIFVGIWVLLGLAVLVLAASGGPRGARNQILQNQSKSGRKVAAGLFVLGYVGLGIAIPAIVIANDRTDRLDEHTGLVLTKAQDHGRALFGQKCQQCHTLAGANAVGEVGPNLDQMRPPAPLVYDALINGRVRGAGTMPAQLVTGQDAKDVAAFVARVAGQE
ncbi:MAG: cytochrome c [Solirubrobacterales bacterium]|nr:cytochrome c [Solirubrobacterales bacterium]